MISSDTDAGLKFGLVRIFDAATSTLDHWNKDHVDTLIDVGEYSLALDELASAYINSGKPVSQEISKLFEILATKMQMVPGDEYEGVAALRARARH